MDDEWDPEYYLRLYNNSIREPGHKIKNQIHPMERITYPVVKISGYYDKESKTFQSLSAYPYPYGSSYNITPSFKKENINWKIKGSAEYIKIQLQDPSGNIKEVRTSGNTYLEIFYGNTPKTVGLDRTHFFVSLFLFGKGKYRVRFSTGTLSIDEKGLTDKEDKGSVQEIEFDWSGK